MDNIFKGAKFGDKFLTRDKRVAIYLYKSITNFLHLEMHNLILEGDEDISLYSNNGIVFGNSHCIVDDGTEELWDDDIVSKWQDIIDEKELDRLADKDCPYFADTSRMERQDWVNGFKEGYKKALE